MRNFAVRAIPMKTTRAPALALAWLFAASPLHGRFTPPADGPVAFRRDRLALDPATLSDLSRQLVAIARNHPMRTPEERRHTAKSLALALALDPRNDEARHLISRYCENQWPDTPQPTAAPARTDAIWKTIGWLASPQAGTHGHTLATLLLDVAAATDPDHPRARAHAGEATAWSGWIPPLTAYQEFTTPPPPPSPPVTPDTEPDAPGNTAVPPLAKASLRTLVWQKSKPTVVTLRMQASLPPETSEKPDKPEPLQVGPRPAEGGANPLTRTITSLLASRSQVIPHHLRVHITCPEDEAALAGHAPRHLSAAAALLASAAVTGNEPDALVLGEVDANGRLSLPPDFWLSLVSLQPDAGRKLILPTDAASVLPSLLALEKPRFFLDHEVLLARDFDHLLTLAAKLPSAEIATAATSFADLRQRASGPELRDFLANRFVRQRLEELASQAPWHASASMLALQSAGLRPFVIHRAVLAAELRVALAPMDAVTAALHRGAADAALTARENTSLGGILEQCREKIDRFEKVTARTDQDLFQAARSLTVTLRTLERTTRSRTDPGLIHHNIHRLLSDYEVQYEALEKLLREEESKGLTNDAASSR